MYTVKRAYIELHLAVFLFGLTAILGDLIQLSAVVLVWWRVFLACISLLFVKDMLKAVRQMPRIQLYRFLLIGVLVALHWICFYGAIKLSNASIALVCMATTSFFTSLIEPFVFKKRVVWYEIVLGLLIIPGMALVVNHVKLSMMAGVWVGLLAAVLASIFATLNKKYIHSAEPIPITFIELGSVWLFISLIFPFYFFATPEASFLPQGMDWIYLLILSLLCTTLAYVLALRPLKVLTAFASNLTINLEPVYGILLAMLILKEHQELSSGFYLGVGIILVAVILYPFIRRYHRKREKATQPE